MPLVKGCQHAMRAVPDAIADAVAVAGCAEVEAALTPTAALERPTLCGGPAGAAVAAASGCETDPLWPQSWGVSSP